MLGSDFIPASEIRADWVLYIATSYAQAFDILPILHAIVMANHLVLYNAETNKTIFNIEDLGHITLWLRAQECRRLIDKEVAPIWRNTRIYTYQNKRDNYACYSVTLKKMPQKPFLERVKDFYACLNSNLIEGEKLICEDEAFVVCGHGYSLVYVLEGYCKHPNMLGYYQNGIATQKILCRMSFFEAHRWLDKCTNEEVADIYARLSFTEMRDKYPNPAERFVESVRITKWQRKQTFRVRYCGVGTYGSEILMHVVPSVDADVKSISALAIDEDDASFILPFVQEIYPYFYERYYLEENHLPSQMWQKIIDRIKEVRDILLRDPQDVRLKRYIEQFELKVLDRNGNRRIAKNSLDYQPIEFLRDHRYEIARLWEIFVQWSERQIRTYYYTSCGLMFNIQGP